MQSLKKSHSICDFSLPLPPTSLIENAYWIQFSISSLVHGGNPIEFVSVGELMKACFTDCEYILMAS